MNNTQLQGIGTVPGGSTDLSAGSVPAWLAAEAGRELAARFGDSVPPSLANPALAGLLAAVGRPHGNRAMSRVLNAGWPAFKPVGQAAGLDPLRTQREFWNAARRLRALRKRAGPDGAPVPPDSANRGDMP